MSGIKIDFGANVQPFNDAMGHVRGSVDRLASGLAGKLTGALGLTSLVYAAERYVNKLHDISEESAKMGVGTDFFQKLAYSADRSGSSIGVVESSVKRLNRYIYQLGSGGAGSVELSHTFAAIGLTFADLEKKSPEEKLKKVIQALGGVTDATERSALASKLFGRSGADLNEFLKNYNTLAAEAETKGLIKESTIKAADELVHSFKDIGLYLGVIASESGVFEKLAKGVGSYSKALVEAKEARKTIETTGMTGDYASKQSKLMSFLRFGAENVESGAVLNIPAPAKSERDAKKKELETAKVEALRAQETRDAELKRQEQYRLDQASKEREKLDKKLRTEETNLNILKAENELNEYNFGIYKIIAETNKKIADEKNKELKNAIQKEGNQKLQNYYHEYANKQKEAAMGINEEIVLGKVKQKVDRKEISEKEYQIYARRMQEQIDLDKARKESGTPELMNAIKEKASLDIQSIINSKGNSELPFRGIMSDMGTGVQSDLTRVQDTALALQKKSLDYQKSMDVTLKEIEKKSAHSTYN